jgi:hypothetical protein
LRPIYGLLERLATHPELLGTGEREALREEIRRLL